MQWDKLAHVVRFEARRVLMDRTVWIAFGIFTAIVLFGAYDYWTALPPRPQGSRLIADGAIVTLALALHTGIANDRTSNFDIYVTSNFVDPLTAFVGKVISTTLFVTALTIFSFLLVMVTALGDFGFASSQASRIFVLSLVLLPAIIVIELIQPSRYPTLLLLVFLIIFFTIYRTVGDVRAAVEWSGLDAEFSAGEGLLRIVLSAGLVGLLYPLYLLRFRRFKPTRV